MTILLYKVVNFNLIKSIHEIYCILDIKIFLFMKYLISDQQVKSRIQSHSLYIFSFKICSTNKVDILNCTYFLNLNLLYTYTKGFFFNLGDVFLFFLFFGYNCILALTSFRKLIFP